jgi:peptidoglycan/xylan/chitin deacetylase (PgdA/CDA1 family)
MAIVPIVLHRIVNNNQRLCFEDVELSVFDQILSYCSNKCIPLNGDFAPCKEHIQENKYILTFDDGYSSDYEFVLDRLISNNCHATFFIIADRLNEKGYLSLTQLKEMAALGMTIGSHSFSHPEMPNIHIKQQYHELAASRLLLEDALGCPVKSFSFPYGKYNKRLIEMAVDAGYNRICTSQHGVISDPSVKIPRNSINGTMSWSVIERSLKAEALIRISWAVEDLGKQSLKTVLGDKGYKFIRNYRKTK